MYRLVHKRDERGPYTVWEPQQVGRTANEIIDGTVFLYPTEAEARSEDSRGGASGFLLSMKSEVGSGHVYVVTNAHVARFCSSVRTSHSTDPYMWAKTWHRHPNGDDVAIAYMGLAADVAAPITFDISVLATQVGLAKRFVGAGDEVYMVGRFIGLDVGPRNRPTVRYGVLAMNETVEIENAKMEKHRQESFAVEMHSRSGYSGSPVFLDLDPLKWTDPRKPREQRIGHDLIGITWGMFPHYSKILDEDTEQPINESWVMTDNSGIELVVPSWKITELLAQEDVVAERKAREAQERRTRKRDGEAVATSADEGFTRTDFETALRKVSRRKPSPPEP